MNQIELSVGEQYIVRLMPIASAGYTWEHVLEGESGVADVAVTTISPSPDTLLHRSTMQGTSFEKQFTIKGIKPGNTNIRFLLHRPFEHDKPALEERILELTVH